MKYIDTNIFGYAIENSEKYGRSCTRILQDLEDGKIMLACSHLVPIELMGVLSKINKERKKQKLPPMDVERNIEAVLSYPIAWLDINFFIIRKAASHSSELMASDRIHAATMELNDIKEIISADTDFDTIPGIRRIDPLEYK
ncbi:MAG: type II toxin-antitoxin system VapC family toxin [archaeon]